MSGKSKDSGQIHTIEGISILQTDFQSISVVYEHGTMHNVYFPTLFAILSAILSNNYSMQKLERLEEATSRSNEELREGIRDIAGKKSRLELILKEEQTLREVYYKQLFQT